MSQSIAQLPPHIVMKIAAGEVIERPACVLKELLENAVDAEASSIHVNISEGGMALVEVRDDGWGVPKDQLKLALTPHATSKVRDDEDLFKIMTRGFRGEALASMAAVSHLSMASTVAKQDTGFEIRSDGPRIGDPSPHGIAQGTHIQVKDLFYNTPGRRKFLKSSQTEKQHLIRTFYRIALSEPAREFTFSQDGQILIDLPAADTLIDRIGQIFGEDKADHLLQVSHRHPDMDVTGFVSDRELSFSRGSEIWIFVNGRPVSDKTVLSALTEGYRTAMMEKRYPMAFIYLKLPPDVIDINIHPRKNEVRFKDASAIFRYISTAVKTSLNLQQEGAATAYPSGEKTHADTYSGPSVALSQNHLIGNNANGHDRSVNYGASFSAKTPSVSSKSAYPNIPRSLSSASVLRSDTQNSYLTPELLEKMGTPVEASNENASHTFFSRLKFLDHVDHTYLIFKHPDEEKLIIIDQHAAHERVLFAQFKDRHKNKIHSQGLLIPEHIDLSAELFEICQLHRDALLSMGIVFENFGERTVLIRSFPIHFKGQHPKSIFVDLCRDLQEVNPTAAWDDEDDRILSSMACHSAVRAHDALSESEIKKLMQLMDQSTLSSYCPHGRPTFISYDVPHLEKLFKRV